MCHYIPAYVFFKFIILQLYRNLQRHICIYIFCCKLRENVYFDTSLTHFSLALKILSEQQQQQNINELLFKQKYNVRHSNGTI